jgi:N-acyl-phosphatidylethanolamine-hydrolysing phospholipase D
MKKTYLITPFLFLTLIAATLFAACSAKDKNAFSETEWARQVDNTDTGDLYAPHSENGRFFSPWMKMKDKSFLDVLGWKLFSKTDYTEEEKRYLPKVLPDTAQRIRQAHGDFILWIGHNTFLVRINGIYWLTDPIFSKRALLPARFTPPAITIKELNAIAPNINIIVSHNHYDHLDADSMEQLPRNAAVYVPLGLKSVILKMNKEKVVEMDWWQETNLPGNSRLVCLPAQHWSLRMGQGRNESLWASWMLITPDTTIYFGGDSGYFKGFSEIGKKFPQIDYAFMATTAYHPRWFMHYQHMNIKEAVRAFDDLGAKFFIPTQWGTFHLGNEPPGFPGLDLERHIKDNLLDPARFSILDIGQILPI